MLITSGADPGIFYWGGGGEVGGGSKLWFRKDCRTFLWKITSPAHPLPPVAVAHHNFLAPYAVLEFYS